MVRNLRQFLDLLRTDDDLVIIDAPVDPNLELAEIHRRVIHGGGPALLFTNVLGSSYPVVTNLFGSLRRVERAFGPRPQQLVRDLVACAEALAPPRLGELWKRKHLAWEALKIGTRQRRRGPVLEACDAPARLEELPILTTWQEDGGPFVTLPLVYTEQPDQPEKHNLGMYRLQRFDSQTTGMHWQIHKGGGFHYHQAEQRDEALPVTVFLGGPPALILAAIAPLPEDVGELALASLLAGGKIDRVRIEGHPHRLIAEAEFALCGSVAPRERRPEGPFGDHYGYYSLRHDFPVFHVERIYHRRDAIYPATVVGKPRQEDFFIGDYLQDLLSPLFPLVMPSVRDLWSYGETGFHSLAAAVVKDRYPREAMVSAFRILGEGQLSLTKFLLLTDSPIDLKDFRALLTHVLARTRLETDLFVFANLSMDTLDYSGPQINEGSKGVWLGLGDPIRELPAAFSGPLPPGVEAARPFCPGCLVVSGPDFESERDLPRRLAAWDAFRDWPLLVVADDVSIADHVPSFLWATFTRFEPAADIHARSERIVRHHVSLEGPVILDARMKPTYPDELIPDPEVARRVESRWSELFPQAQVRGVATGRGLPDLPDSAGS